MKTKAISIFIFFLIIILPFTVTDRNDNVKPEILSKSTVGYYQSTTCNISFLEFVLKNSNNDISIYYNNNDYADINCYGKITGVDLNGETFFVSIGTNASINLLLQSSIWLLLFYLIPVHKKTNKLNIFSSLLISFIFTFQLFAEERFYRRTNILYDSEFEIDNFYIFGKLLLFLLIGLICYDLFSIRYKNLLNYIPFLFIFVGTYSGMNLNIFLVILSFFGINSFLSKKINKYDLIYFLFSIFWISNTDLNDYFFDGDKLRGFINSNYNIYSQFFWLLIFYLSTRGILFLINEGNKYFNNKIFLNNLLISGALVLFFGVLGSYSPIANFLNFIVFGQNKRGIKTFDSVDGNTWRGFSASAESVGEFYGFVILFFFIFFFVKKENYDSKMILLLIPIFYGLYRSNNFASFSSLVVLIMLIIFYNFLANRNVQTHFFKLFIILISLITGIYLLNSDYQYVSTELLFESTLHQGFYDDPGSYRNFKEIEKKMLERDLKSMLLIEKNLNEASNSYKFLVSRFTSDLNIPFLPNLISIISVISLLINRTEMWGIFIAKYDPNITETIFGSGPLQINEYLYGEKVFLDVPYYKIESLFLPHSSYLDFLVFFGASGVLILSFYILFNLYKSDKADIFYFPTVFLIINFLKSDSILYLNSFVLITFCIYTLSKNFQDRNER
tara:strand:+ start:936 stop:2957 length:2022 start_codon:yes stop_codon:yes gene_type:complete